MKQSMQCLITGEILTEDQALRFVVGPDEKIWFDPSFKAEGRSVFLKNEAHLLEKALEDGLFEAHLKAQVADDLKNQTVRMLEKRFFEALGLSRKARQLLLGVEKVEKSYWDGKIAFALVPIDIGADALKKMRFLEKDGLTLICVSDKKILSHTLGVPNVSVIGVQKGHGAEKVLKMLKRYQPYEVSFLQSNDEK